MSVITFPTGLRVQRFTWKQIRLDLTFNSIFGSQATEVSGPLWGASLESDQMSELDSGAWQSLLMRLKGQTNQLGLWNIARPAPLGTMRGTMTLNIAAAQGATTLSIIEDTQPSTTLKAGDLLGIGTSITQQVVMVMTDVTADGSGIISVTIQPPLRNAHLIAASVTWDKPQVLFRRTQSEASWDYEEIKAMGFTLELVEDWRS